MTPIRQPRWAVKVGGKLAVGAVSVTLTTNVMFTADTFQVILAASAKPLGMDWAAWVVAMHDDVEVRAGFPADPLHWTADELPMIFWGESDSIEVDPVADTITLTGRDLTARFIDKKVIAKFPNLTPSQIAAQFAAEYGMQTEITPTTTKAGRFYQIDHVQMSTTETQWDLLTFLAQQLNWDCYVFGKTLYFGPKPAPNTNVFVIQAPTGRPQETTNVIGIQFARSFTVARDVIVQVRSWNTKFAKGFTKTAKSSFSVKTPLVGQEGGVSPGDAGNAQIYSYTIPRLTPNQALQKAQALLEQITRHELRVQIQMAGDVIPGKAQPIHIQGSGSIFDQHYWPFQITRTMQTSPNGADEFSMEIHAKNHSPQSVVLA